MDAQSSLRGGAGRVFTRQAPPLQQAGGVILGVIPAAPPSGASPRSFPGRGPFLPTCFNGDQSGERAGAGAGAANPKKTRPAPGRLAGRGGELGRGPAFFGAPEAP